VMRPLVIWFATLCAIAKTGDAKYVLGSYVILSFVAIDHSSSKLYSYFI
jgi:hypothetical protein